MKFKSMINMFRDSIFNIIGYISLILTLIAFVCVVVLTIVLLYRLIVNDEYIKKTLIEIGISLGVGGVSCGLFCFCRENY